jgi:hypothetical protein
VKWLCGFTDEWDESHLGLHHCPQDLGLGQGLLNPHRPLPWLGIGGVEGKKASHSASHTSTEPRLEISPSLREAKDVLTCGGLNDL